jgi:SAM-dependent methyltransferase
MTTVRAGTAPTQARREDLEIRFWSESPDEAPGADSVGAFTNKMAEARVVLEKFDAFDALLRKAGTIIEVGGGQCWVSCLLRKRYGDAKRVIGSDIAPDAVASVPEWERIFRVRLDGALACRSYDLPFQTGSVDVLLVFAAAHHFGAHRRTLREVHRVLKPGGTALYLHEPACPQALHGLARKRVMAKRPVVPEDVLVHSRLRALARDAHLETKLVYSPTTTNRGPMQTLYYLGLQKLPFLQRWLPCSIDFVFTKGDEIIL